MHDEANVIKKFRILLFSVKLPARTQDGSFENVNSAKKNWRVWENKFL